jgi:hypothetical protein
MIALLALFGCVSDGAPTPTPHGTWVEENLLLPDGAAQILSFDECTDLQPLPVKRPNGEVLGDVPFWSRAWAMSDGSTLVMAAASCSGAVVDKYVKIGSDGGITPMGRPSVPAYATTPDPRGVSVAGGLLLVDCAAGVSMWADPFGSLSAVDASAMCAAATGDWVIGPSDQGRVALANVASGALSLSAWALSGSTLVEQPDGDATSAAADRDRVLWVHESAIGQHRWLLASDAFGDLRLGDVSGASISAGAPHPADQHPPVAFVDGNGDVIVAIVDEEGAMSVTSVDPFAGSATPVATAAPGVSLPLHEHAWYGLGQVVTTATDPTEDDAVLDSPVEVDLRRYDGAMVVTETAIPSTPCVERWHCREIGESHLLAVAGGQGVYGLWDWYGYGAIYAVTTDRQGP